MAISANENRFQEAMARPEILVQLRDLASRYPDITVALTEGECWEVWGDMEHHERWQYGACHGWNRMPLTMIEPSYLLGWAYGRRSEAPPRCSMMWGQRNRGRSSTISRLNEHTAAIGGHHRHCSGSEQSAAAVKTCPGRCWGLLSSKTVVYDCF